MASTQNEGLSAVIYCRVSSQRQVRDGHGLASQETRCREFARSKGYEIAEVFHDEGVSGGSISRPGMQRLLNFVASIRDLHPVVLVDDVSRFARGIEAHIHLRAAIGAAGGRLESPSVEFGEDSDSILVENLLASVSQHQRQKNTEQVINRMRARAQGGYWISSPVPGYRFAKVEGHGKLLVRDEPLATVIQEALEGFAHGRFATQSEVGRFLEGHSCFPRGRDGKVHLQRVKDILQRVLYAGYIHLPDWDIRYSLGKHEPIVSFETWKTIQDRINNPAKMPTRSDIGEDFALRGMVKCHGCDKTYFSGWSKGRNQSYAYYFCRSAGCEFKGKNVRREKLHGDLDELFSSLRPSDGLFQMALAIFQDLWAQRMAGVQSELTSAGATLRQVTTNIEHLLDRIKGTDTQSVISAYESRLQALERERASLQEKLARDQSPALDFDRSFRTAFQFLANPQKLWLSERIELKRIALNVTFTDKLSYVPNEGFRTVPKSMPFLLLEQFCGVNHSLADRRRHSLAARVESATGWVAKSPTPFQTACTAVKLR